MTDRDVREELADGIGFSIDRLIGAAARDGGVVVPALIVDEVLAQNPLSKLSRVEMAQAVLLAAAAKGLAVQTGRA